MPTKSECFKKFKKIAIRSTALARKERRIAKEYSKLSTNYSTIREINAESTNNLNSAKLVVRKKSQKVEALKQLEEEREDELDKVKEDIRVLQDKIAALHKNETRSDKNKLPFEKLLEMCVLKTCTKTHISNKDPNVIEGFTANTWNSAIIPFQIDRGPKTKNEIEDAMWENTFRCNPHAKQWEHLFNPSSQ